MVTTIRPIIADVGITGVISSSGRITVDNVVDMNREAELFGERVPPKGIAEFTTWKIVETEEDELVLVLRKKKREALPQAV